MQLLYDGRCSLCRSLAFKLHFRSAGKLELLSLSTPEATAALDRFHPNGWTWDFYVIDGDSCRRGVRALPALIPAVGVTSLLGAVGEYVRAQSVLRKAQATCGGHGNQPVPPSQSRRAALRAAALAPVAFGLSKLPAPASSLAPFDESGILIHTAEVVPGAGGFRIHVSQCRECVRAAPASTRSVTGRPASQIRKSAPDAMIVDQALTVSRAGAIPARVRMARSSFELWRERPNAAPVLRGRPTVHVAGLEHPRFGGTVGVAHDGRTTMGGMIRHDLPVPIADYIVVSDNRVSSGTHVAAYAAAVAELRNLHDRAGRTELAAVYAEIALNLAQMSSLFENTVGGVASPARSRLTLTSMPEMLAFVQLPARLRRLPAPAPEPDADGTPAPSGPRAEEAEDEQVECGWDCGCGCAMCIGCGCGVGFCLPPGVCGCSACYFSCSCGCGYCCWPSGDDPEVQ
jgi:hypothetical protein